MMNVNSVIIDGIARQLTGKGYVNINGVLRPYQGKGYVNVDGVLKELIRPIGTLDVGSKVKIKINNVLTNFIIVQQGLPINVNADAILPNGLYHESCNGTWLLMEDTISQRFDEVEVGISISFDQFGWNSHLKTNGTIWNSIDSDIRNMIKTVKIPYFRSSNLYYGSNGATTKLFLLSLGEIGYRINSLTPYNTDGCKLKYFQTGNSLIAKRFGGTARVSWALRTNGKGHAMEVTSTGSVANCKDDENYLRPAFILPFHTPVLNNDCVIASNTIISESTFNIDKKNI